MMRCTLCLFMGATHDCDCAQTNPCASLFFSLLSSFLLSPPLPPPPNIYLGNTNNLCQKENLLLFASLLPSLPSPQPPFPPFPSPATEVNRPRSMACRQPSHAPPPITLLFLSKKQILTLQTPLCRPFSLTPPLTPLVSSDGREGVCGGGERPSLHHRLTRRVPCLYSLFDPPPPSSSSSSLCQMPSLLFHFLPLSFPPPLGSLPTASPNTATKQYPPLHTLCAVLFFVAGQDPPPDSFAFSLALLPHFLASSEVCTSRQLFQPTPHPLFPPPLLPFTPSPPHPPPLTLFQTFLSGHNGAPLYCPHAPQHLYTTTPLPLLVSLRLTTPHPTPIPTPLTLSHRHIPIFLTARS
eukprot:Rhum_TRINITY_DN14613_c11_g2::Rhum_TRINITY_DN14613_c11_g2_i1::g.109039::m.109039